MIQLALGIIEVCLAGTANGLALGHLMRRRLPGAWQAQREQLGIRA